MWDNLALVIEWLITGTVYLHLVLILALFKSGDIASIYDVSPL